MNTNIPQNLKDKVAALEQSMLAVDTLNNICQASISGGAPVIALQDLAHMLNHLIEPAMYQVEALKQLIDELQPRPLLIAA